MLPKNGTQILLLKSEEHLQVSKLLPLREWLEQYHKSKRKFKSDKERKHYVCNELKMQVQKDPTRNGILCVPVQAETNMLSGLRISASRVKEQKFENKSDAKEAFQKAAISAKTNTKARISNVTQEMLNWLATCFFALPVVGCG